ncbi:MAG: zinc metallopeptidase [Clostridia bacterium]
MFYSFWDPTMLIILPGLVIAFLAQMRVNSTFAKYGKIAARSGYTGASMARALLNGAGLQDVAIARVRGSLTDNYDPAKRVLNLSESVYDSSSIAALGVAAHECGHALQDKESYAPLKLRSVIVPTVNIGSNLSWPIFLIGLIFSWKPLLLVGIILFSLTVLFTLVTLPVEFNASRRATQALASGGYLSQDELTGAKSVLGAAAMTYVASALNAILQLLRLLALSRRHDD